MLSALVAAPVPSLSSLFDLQPVGTGPPFERSEQLVEGPPEFGEPVEGGGVDASKIEVAYDKAVAFGSSEGVGQHLVRDAVKSFVEFLVAPAPVP
jgi:hypothetical protein